MEWTCKHSGWIWLCGALGPAGETRIKRVNEEVRVHDPVPTRTPPCSAFKLPVAKGSRKSHRDIMSLEDTSWALIPHTHTCTYTHTHMRRFRRMISLRGKPTKLDPWLLGNNGSHWRDGLAWSKRSSVSHRRESQKECKPLYSVNKWCVFRGSESSMKCRSLTIHWSTIRPHDNSGCISMCRIHSLLYYCKWF